MTGISRREFEHEVGYGGGARWLTSVTTVIFTCTPDRFNGASRANMLDVPCPGVGLFDHYRLSLGGVLRYIWHHPGQIPTIYRGRGGGSPVVRFRGGPLGHAIDRCITLWCWNVFQFPRGSIFSYPSSLFLDCFFSCSCVCQCGTHFKSVFSFPGCPSCPSGKKMNLMVHWLSEATWHLSLRRRHVLCSL